MTPSKPRSPHSPCGMRRACTSLSRVFRILNGPVVPVALVLALSSLLAGCGSDTVTTESRPSRAIEVSARIGPKGVQISPVDFGAGLANVTIANLTDFPASFSIEGPTTIQGSEIQPGSSANLQGDFLQGSYRAVAMTAAGLQSFAFEVGPPRANSNQELLLP